MLAGNSKSLNNSSCVRVELDNIVKNVNKNEKLLGYFVKVEKQ